MFYKIYDFLVRVVVYTVERDDRFDLTSSRLRKLIIIFIIIINFWSLF